jgi:hypothetical protein
MRLGHLGWGLLLLLVGLAGADSAGADSRFYVVGGIGFISVGGENEAAQFRSPGWSATAGLRLAITDRLKIGVNGEYARAGFDATEFFEQNNVFLSNPEERAEGGDLEILAATGEVILDIPVDKTTVLYAKVGGGMYSWTTTRLFVNNQGIESVIPESTIDIPDGESPGGYAGGGVRFPLGESAGIWIAFSVVFLEPDNGAMRLIPLRVGISLP